MSISSIASVATAAIAALLSVIMFFQGSSSLTLQTELQKRTQEIQTQQQEVQLQQQELQKRQNTVDTAKQLAQQQGPQAIASLISLARDPEAAQTLAGQDVAAWVEAAARHPALPPRLRVAAWDLPLAARPAEMRSSNAKIFALLAKYGVQITDKDKEDIKKLLDDAAKAKP